MPIQIFMIIIFFFLLIFLLFIFFLFFIILFFFSKRAFIFFTGRYQEAPLMDNFTFFGVFWLCGNIMLMQIVLSILEAFYLQLGK